jgi:hypothetical protein
MFRAYEADRPDDFPFVQYSLAQARDVLFPPVLIDQVVPFAEVFHGELRRVEDDLIEFDRHWTMPLLERARVPVDADDLPTRTVDLPGGAARHDGQALRVAAVLLDGRILRDGAARPVGCVEIPAPRARVEAYANVVPPHERALPSDSPIRPNSTIPGYPRIRRGLRHR